MWLTNLFRRCPLFGAGASPVTEHPVVDDGDDDDTGDECRQYDATRVSREKIDEIVEGFMQNNSVNTPLLPDFIEKAVYKNVITLMMGIAEEVLAETSIEVLGHRIKLRLTT